jgi:hypothetical protein
MAFFDQYANRLNEAVVKHLTDGLCTYHPATGPDVSDVPYQFDNEFEVIDENGIGRRVKTLLLPVAMVGDVDRRAEFTVEGKRWRYNGPVEDDGAFVRIEVV